MPSSFPFVYNDFARGSIAYLQGWFRVIILTTSVGLADLTMRTGLIRSGWGVDKSNWEKGNE